MNISISKRKLWHFVNKKIRRTIHHYHVFSVITILFDEILHDLKSGIDLKVHNFGTLTLKTLKPRKYFDINHKQVMHSKGYKILRFILSNSIRKKIVNHLDRNKKDD